MEISEKTLESFLDHILRVMCSRRDSVLCTEENFLDETWSLCLEEDEAKIEKISKKVWKNYAQEEMKRLKTFD